MRSLKASVLLILVSFMSFGSAFAASEDFTSAQTAFENRMLNRLEMVLAPLVGQDNFSINLSVETKEASKARNADEVYFSKLGFSARITNNANYRYEDDITNMSIDISITDKIKGLDEDMLKKRIEATAKAALPQFKKPVPVTITSFTPVKTSSMFSDPRFWTPVALIICAGFIVFGLITASGQLSKINLGGALNSTSSGDKSAALANVFDPAKTANKSGNGSSIDTFEGIEKWAQWTTEDLPSACNFVEKLSRSEDEADLALLAYIFHGSDLISTKKMLAGLRKDALNKVKKVTEFELKTDTFADLDAVLTQHITQHFVYQSLDSDHLLQYIHDFTIDEAVYITGQDPSMLELFMKYYSTPQMEQIMGWVSFEALSDFLKSRPTKQFNLNAMAKQAHQMVLERRKSEEGKSESSVTKWLEVASQLDSERELAFYKSMVASTPAGELESIALESFPQFLIEELPEKILKPSLNSYPLEERADYLFTLSTEQRTQFLDFFKSEPRVHEVLEIEIEQITADIARRTVIENRKDTIVKEFNERIRKYIRSSGENQQIATDVFNKWIAEARQKDAKHSSAA